MATFTSTPPPGAQPARRNVSEIEVSESLSPAQQAAELPSALGVPVAVGAVSVPVPSLAALALLEQIESPYIGGRADMDTMATIRALYCVAKPRQAMTALAPAIRSAAALDGLAERSQSTPEAWERYIEALPALIAAAWRRFDEACADYAETLGATACVDLAQALADQIGLASRGYEMIPPEDADSPKAAAVSESNTSPCTP